MSQEKELPGEALSLAHLAAEAGALIPPDCTAAELGLTPWLNLFDATYAERLSQLILKQVESDDQSS